MKKGMVFALDAAIAATILILIVINSFYYFSTSSRESFSQIQLLKIGADIITVFESSSRKMKQGRSQSLSFPSTRAFRQTTSLSCR